MFELELRSRNSESGLKRLERLYWYRLTAQVIKHQLVRLDDALHRASERSARWAEGDCQPRLLKRDESWLRVRIEAV